VDVQGLSVAVTGGASGLGLATVKRLADRRSQVTIIDLPTSNGAAVAEGLGESVCFTAADVTDEQQLAAALDVADSRGGLRALVHCAGGSRRLRLLDKEGHAGSLDDFKWVVNLNLIGAFNALRLGAERIGRSELVGDERGVIVLTASVAAYEGQIGQMPYAATKAGIVGMTLNGARDLASKGIRVCSIAPGIMDTPLLGRLRDDVLESLKATVPNPVRLGHPDEFAHLALTIVENGYLNGETIRLDGAIRMAPR
jgi:NAD(P)-dependent dehydrogenase (short-subunit alcohol dehydrogenase family)